MPTVSSPRQRRSWPARAALVLLALVLGGCTWLFAAPPAGQGFATGPVVVLGGGTGDRLDLGRQLADAADEPRDLVLSAGAAATWEAAGGDCDEDGVLCFEPEPDNTYGEARTVAALAGQHGWEAVTVVTSDYHVTRTRLLFSYCMDTPTRVVASSSGLPLATRADRFVREVVGTVGSLPAYWYC